LKEARVMGELPRSTDVSEENAKKQFHEAMEMTLMGWVRTSLTLIGFGFAIGEAFSFVRTGEAKNTLNTPRLSLVTTVAVSLIVLGVLGLLGAIIQCGWSLKRFNQGSLTTYERPWRISVLVAVVLLLIGLVALVAMTLP
jgi:putative membrane protein